MKTPVWAVAAAILVAGCAAGTSSGEPGFNRDRISRAEVLEAGPSTAYELIQKLRPIWLRKRGPTSYTQEGDIVVYLDGTRLGERESLRTIRTENIETLEYLDARRATARYGTGHIYGAILIRSTG